MSDAMPWVLVGMGEWRVHHIRQLRHHSSASPAVIVRKVVGYNLFLNIIPNNFTARTERKVWCDQGMSEPCLGSWSLPQLGASPGPNARAKWELVVGPGVSAWDKDFVVPKAQSNLGNTARPMYAMYPFGDMLVPHHMYSHPSLPKPSITS